MVSLLLLSFLGCASPFEGTWLFLADRQQKVSGDCEDPDDTSVLTGTSKSWVDIYGLSSGELVVLVGEPLIGTAEGNELKATWSESYENEDYSQAQDIELDGTLEAGIFSGTVATTYVETNGEDTYECTASNRFTAERTVSSPEAYPEN